MFAWDVEGRIGMLAGLRGVRDQTSCPKDFAPVLLLGARGLGPIPPCALQLGATHVEPNADGASERRKGRLDQKKKQ